jgi:hypothetical protein
MSKTAQKKGAQKALNGMRRELKFWKKKDQKEARQLEKDIAAFIRMNADLRIK